MSRLATILALLALGSVWAARAGSALEPSSAYLRYLRAASIDYGAFPVDRDDLRPMGQGAYPGTTYYVAQDGSDGNDGHSIADPLRTIQKALELSRDGDAVLVRGGTYVTGDVANVYDSGRQLHSNFILAAYPGEKVILQSDAPGQWEHRDALWLNGPLQNVVIDGFELRGFTASGVQFGNPADGEAPQRNIILKRLMVRGADAGIVTQYGEHPATKAYIDGLLLQDVLLLDVGTYGFNAGQSAEGDVAVYKNIHLDRVKIRCRGGGDGNSGSDALALENGSNVLIENTLVEGAAADGIDTKADRVAVVNCIARHLGRNGIKGWRDIEILNTLSFDTGADANLVLDAGQAITVRDSVFAYHNARSGAAAYSFTVAYDQASTYSGRVTFDRCIFFGNTAGGFIPGGAALTLTGNTFWAIGDRQLFEHAGATPPGYAFEDIGRLNAESWAEDNRVADPGFVRPSFAADNLTTGSLDGPGYKDILIDRYFAELEAGPRPVPAQSLGTAGAAVLGLAAFLRIVRRG
jgi:parallel beta helix pectate lyase-like protein